jgi:adenosylcobinamide kinase/adenosylcobinamide-phosphate guanylyltransferase
MKKILITGGARSGKSRFAQQLAADFGGKVLFVATAEAKDEAMRLRIEAPRGVSAVIRGYTGEADVVVIDCITMLVSNTLLREQAKPDAEELVLKEIEALAAKMDELAVTFITVTNEVGLGLVPDSELGRRYRDCLGKANQVLTRHADEVYLMVAGLPIRLK